MKILYHIPSLDSIYAQRSIYHGFKNAFIDLGHHFVPFTSNDSLESLLRDYRPDIFITATHSYYRKYINYDLLSDYRRDGLFVLAKIDFWNSPLSPLRINEARSLRTDKPLLRLIDEDKIADAYFHVLEQDDERMDGFTKITGHKYHTIPLAADSTLQKPDFKVQFCADVSYVGTALPEKKKFFLNNVYPLKTDYLLRIYGQDWTYWDRALGWIQRGGQYLDIKSLAKIRKPKLNLSEEAEIYTSSVISINVHEEYQRKYGGDCNERTFKIPLCSGFEVVDNVSCIGRYFVDGKEMIIAKSAVEWTELVRYYLRFPEERLPIIEAGRRKVLNEHTYHNRVKQIIKIMQEK
jgi:spore maturation protein CgeB